MQEQNDIKKAEKVGQTTRNPENSFQEMLNAIGDSFSNIASAENEENGQQKEYVEEDRQLGKLSENDEPGWVMCTITKTLWQRMESVGRPR